MSFWFQFSSNTFEKRETWFHEHLRSVSTGYSYKRNYSRNKGARIFKQNRGSYFPRARVTQM